VLCVALSPDTFLFAAAYLSRRDAGQRLGVWRCNGIDDVSRVRDLGVGSVRCYPKSHAPWASKLSWIFLLQEGQIRPKQLCGMCEPGLGWAWIHQPVAEPIARISQR